MDGSGTGSKSRKKWKAPGAFPDGFEPQDFIDKPERPIRRNPKIARILYYSKDIESFGTGLKRIADACNNAGVKYEFKKLKSGFVVCFYRNQEGAGTEGRTDKASNEALNEALNENELMIVKMIQDNPMVKQKDIIAQTSISRAQVQRIMKSLQERGIISHENSKKTGRWIVRINKR